MGEVMNYIFRSLQSSERRLDIVSRTIGRQRKFNKSVTFFAVAVTANIIIGEVERREQAVKIKKLESEIEELKRLEGE